LVNTNKRIVVARAGFGGTATVKAPKHADADLMLLASTDYYHLFLRCSAAERG
jgi:hypothetical protein